MVNELQVQNDVSLVEARSHLQAQIASGRRILVLTGAGISADSGVPTFMGEGQRWNNHDVRFLASPDGFAQDPELIWRWYFYRRALVSQTKPNRAHEVLTELALRYAPLHVATQNVDGLHERSGLDWVLRLHGSLWHNRCTVCQKEREDLTTTFERLPISPCCQALERPAIVWFNEYIPEQAMYDLRIICAMLDTILVIGSSGMVGTTAMIIQMAQDMRKICPIPGVEERPITVINATWGPSVVPADMTVNLKAALAVPALLGSL